MGNHIVTSPNNQSLEDYLHLEQRGQFIDSYLFQTNHQHRFFLQAYRFCSPAPAQQVSLGASFPLDLNKQHVYLLLFITNKHSATHGSPGTHQQLNELASKTHYFDKHDLLFPLVENTN